MSLDELEPLPEDMQRLLRSGRPGVEPPPGAREATSAFVAAHIVVAGALAGTPALKAASAGTHASAIRSWAAMKRSFGVGGLLLGAALGAGGHAAYVAREGRVTASSRPVVSAPTLAPRVASVTSPSSEWSTVEVAPPVPSSPPLTARPSHEDPALRGADSALSAERSLIDTARTAVARGDGASALVTLGRHEREFPHGRLAEERAWLTIQALVLSGRSEDARERAAAFRRSFPRSLMLPALDQVVSSKDGAGP
jgi:hypothetical protein